MSAVVAGLHQKEGQAFDKLRLNGSRMRIRARKVLVVPPPLSLSLSKACLPLWLACR